MTQESPSATLYDDPNRHARPASVEIHPHSAVVHGYQEFTVTRDVVRPLPEDPPLARKQELMAPYVSRRFLAGRTALDLGANGGFFSFWALQNGASEVIAVDMDDEYVQILHRLRASLGFDQLTIANANVAEWKEPADVVMGLALIHWIYSCTAVTGALDAAVGMLADLARYMLIIEWVDPSDRAIQSFGHLEWNKDAARGPYNLATFERALTDHFARWHRIGDVSESRALYVAFKSENELDFSAPLSILHPRETILSSRLLTVYEGIEYWSRIYDDGQRIVKQTTGDLAAREMTILSKLSGPFFPRALSSSRANDGTSVVELERVEGTSLAAEIDAIGSDRARLIAFMSDCLEILEALRTAGVSHRDIRVGNFIVRDGRPVLLDFGWATARGETVFTPRFLGGEGRSPDGVPDDVFAMGRVVAAVAGEHADVGAIAELMSDPDPALRVHDTGVLRAIVRAIAGG